jgi:imidazolonepropionase-like amidohydrolase
MENKKSGKICFIILLLAICLLCPNLKGMDTIFIKNGKIYPITSDPIENGCLLIQEGKIKKIAQEISPPDGAIVIDAGGNHIYPGMIALMTSDTQVQEMIKMKLAYQPLRWTH